MDNTTNQAKVTVDITGSETGEKYAGVFVFRELPTFRERMAASKIRNDITGPNASMNSAEWARAEISAQLQVRVIKAPKWWEQSDGGLDLVDENVVVEIFNAAMKTENDARERLRKAGAESLKDIAK